MDISPPTDDEKIILLGNDLVDLKDPDSLGAIENKEFRRRVFTDDEDLSIDGAPNPLVRLWSIWAAKEAAYKALSAFYPETIFSWKKYKTNREMNSVQFGRHELFLNVQELPEDAILAVTAGVADHDRARIDAEIPFMSELFVWISRVEIPENESPEAKQARILDESRLIRVWTVDQITENFGIAPERISIASRDPEDPKKLLPCKVEAVDPYSDIKSEKTSCPILLLDDQLIPHRLSLSHHGRFISAALYLDPASLTSSQN